MAEWERRDGEKPHVYEGFCLYRDSGPKRNLSGVAEKAGKSPRQIRNWAKVWDWKKRAAAYDDYKDKIKREITLNIFRENALKETENFKRLANSINRLFVSINRKFEDSSDEIDNMSLEAQIKLAASVTKVLPEIQRAVEILSGGNYEEYLSEECMHLAELIRSDTEALELASKLLERLSDKQADSKK